MFGGWTKWYIHTSPKHICTLGNASPWQRWGHSWILEREHTEFRLSFHFHISFHFLCTEGHHIFYVLKDVWFCPIVIYLLPKMPNFVFAQSRHILYFPNVHIFIFFYLRKVAIISIYPKSLYLFMYQSCHIYLFAELRHIFSSTHVSLFSKHSRF